MIQIVVCCPSGLPDTVRQAIAARDDMGVVRETQDCLEALELVKELKASILLFGLDAPNLDSQMMGRLFRSKAKQRVRGVAIVCPNDEDDSLTAIRMGCAGTLLADAPVETVVECLSKVHAGEIWLDSRVTARLMRQFVASKDGEPEERGHAGPVEASSLTRVQRQLVMMMGTVVRRARQAEDSSRAKSRVLANMSHQLRTLLNAIIGFSELMANEVVGPINERQREYLQDSLTCGRELRAVINDILDLAKIEAGRMEVLTERLDPAELIRSEVVEVLRSTAILKGISLQIEGSIGEVFLDSRKLKHIVENFVSNAIKYSPPNSTVLVLIQSREDDAFSIEVVDQGPGIESEKIPLLFNRFQQLDEHASTGGTGLGLALTKELAELLGGRVGVNTVWGKGSSFYVVLPVRGAPVHTQLKDAQLRDSQPRILIVEDESSDRIFLRRALARVGYRVDSAAHLREAIRKCKTTRYDAITLDLVLGVDDGTSLLREIGSLNQQTPVIVVSTAGKPPRHWQTRVHAQLQKPVQPLTLLESLSSAGVFPADHQATAAPEEPVEAEPVRTAHRQAISLSARNRG